MEISLRSKTALVTGAASGIGRAAALLMAASGARLVAADIDAEGARQTARLIEQAGGEACPCACDVTAAAQVQALVEAAVARWGRLQAVS